ncbi:MAG TPA: hypothetical protein VMU54_22480 [Planctomycetota bacterium]|nr:hypothetical protein [Planctomycetota bacterium]
MSDPDIRRVREDLETLRQAAGLSLPFDQGDVRVALALIPVGAILSGWAYFGPHASWRWGLAPGLVLAVVETVRQSRRLKRDPLTRRERSFQFMSVTVLGAGAIGYLLWLKSLGFSLDLAAPSVVFVLGLLCIVLGLSSPGRRAAFGAALCAIPLGLVGSLLKGWKVGVVGGLAITLAGIAAGAIMAWQLAREKASHDPVSH